MLLPSFIQEIKKHAAQGLPGEDAHLELIPVSRTLSSEAKARSTTYRESGVGIILHPTLNGIECILIQRRPYDGVHGGQISFPGGKRDEEDLDLEYTARRECFEEIGLPIGLGELIHPLTEVYIPVSDFIVQPFIFYLNELPELIPNEREVQSIISFDVMDLLEESSFKRKPIQISKGMTLKDIPYFDIHGHVIWGATAMMLSELRAILYKMK